MKMKKGTLLMASGLLLIAGAVGITIYNIVWEERARAASRQATQQLAQAITEAEHQEEMIPDYVKYPHMEMPTVKIDGKHYIGILEIPDLALSLPVMAGECTQDKLKVSPCWYTGSVYMDDMVIAAHNYRSHFGELNTLKPGSEVYFIDGDANIFSYTVGWAEVLDATAVEDMKNAPDRDLTLFTCTYGGRQRYTVRCIKS